MSSSRREDFASTVGKGHARMSSSPERSPRIDADDRTDDPPPEKAAMEDANDEEPVAEAANGRSKGDRSPSPRERSLSPARADSLDKSPVRHRAVLPSGPVAWVRVFFLCRKLRSCLPEHFMLRCFC